MTDGAEVRTHVLWTSAKLLNHSVVAAEMFENYDDDAGFKSAIFSYENRNSSYEIEEKSARRQFLCTWAHVGMTDYFVGLFEWEMRETKKLLQQLIPLWNERTAVLIWFNSLSDWLWKVVYFELIGDKLKLQWDSAFDLNLWPAFFCIEWTNQLLISVVDVVRLNKFCFELDEFHEEFAFHCNMSCFAAIVFDIDLFTSLELHGDLGHHLCFADIQREKWRCNIFNLLFLIGCICSTSLYSVYIILRWNSSMGNGSCHFLLCFNNLL